MQHIGAMSRGELFRNIKLSRSFLILLAIVAILVYQISMSYREAEYTRTNMESVLAERRLGVQLSLENLRIGERHRENDGKDSGDDSVAPGADLQLHWRSSPRRNSWSFWSMSVSIIAISAAISIAFRCAGLLFSMREAHR